MSMNTLIPKHSIVTAALLIMAEAAFGQYVTLTAGGSKQSSQIVNVGSNQMVTVVHLSTDNSTSRLSYLEVVSGGVTNQYQNKDINGGFGAGNSSYTYPHSNLPILAGPATIRAVSVTSAAVCFCTLQITEPGSNFVPVNTVVIPNDSGAPVNVIMESSSDMVNWVSAIPGTYGTSTTNRFFRVRAER